MARDSIADSAPVGRHSAANLGADIVGHGRVAKQRSATTQPAQAQASLGLHLWTHCSSGAGFALSSHCCDGIPIGIVVVATHHGVVTSPKSCRYWSDGHYKLPVAVDRFGIRLLRLWVQSPRPVKIRSSGRYWPRLLYPPSEDEYAVATVFSLRPGRVGLAILNLLETTTDETCPVIIL